MFVRNGTPSPETTAHTVSITLDDGSICKGTLHIAKASGLADHLNGPKAFLILHTLQGERMYLAKSAIRSVRALDLPAVDQLDVMQAKASSFDAHRLLGVEHGAGSGTVRRAYLKLARAYHPDRFQGVELPAEVLEYLTAVAQRANVAYAELSGERAIDNAA